MTTVMTTIGLEAARLIEADGSVPQRRLSPTEYAELLGAFSQKSLQLNPEKLQEFIDALGSKYPYVALVNDPDLREKFSAYFPHVIRGMADYFLVADHIAKRGYSLVLAHQAEPIILLRVAE
jgi:hypothetical protein